MKKRLIVLVALAFVIAAVAASTASAGMSDGGGFCTARIVGGHVVANCSG